MKKWLDAAKRYEASNQPGFKARKKRPSKPQGNQTLEQFMQNGEGEAAKKLLAASKNWILLGESEKAMGRTTSVALTSEGLVRSSQVVGMAAAYTKEKPQQAPVDAKEAMELIERFGGSNATGEVEQELLEKIRGELDQIAVNAP
jgi:streptomycin 6-kinase